MFKTMYSYGCVCKKCSHSHSWLIGYIICGFNHYSINPLLCELRASVRTIEANPEVYKKTLQEVLTSPPKLKLKHKCDRCGEYDDLWTNSVSGKRLCPKCVAIECVQDGKMYEKE